MTKETNLLESTPEIPDTDDKKTALEIKQNRFAYRAYLFLLVMFTLLSGLLIFQGVSENTLGNPDQIINITLLIFLVLSLVFSVYQIRNGKTTSGVWAFFIAMWVVAIGTTLVMTNSSGVFLDNMRGLFGLLVIIPLAWNTLSIKQRNRAIVIQVFMSVLTFALVFYKRQTMPDVPATSSATTSLMSIIMVVMIVGVLYYVIRSFPAGLKFFLNQSIRTKLVAVIVGLSLVAVVILFAVNITSTRKILTSQETENLLSISQQRANDYSEMLSGRVNIMKTFAMAVDENETFIAQNESYSSSTSAIEAQILKLDEQWINASDTNSLVKSVLENELAEKAEEFKETFDELFIETFITDRYGANVAAADRTSDYYQADEGWWQAAYNGGKGAVYIGEAEYDDSAGVWGFNIAVPIYSDETGEVLGIMRTTALFDQFLEKLNQGLSETADVQIAFPSGVAIAPDGSIETLPEEHMAKHQFSETAEFTIVVEEGESFFAVAAFVVSEENPDIQNAGWRIFIHQPEASVLAPVRQQTTTSVLIAVVVALAVSAIAAFLAQRISNPIVKLTEMAREFAAGNYDVRTDVITTDEVGQLSQSFNAMAEEVGLRTVELQERSREMEASQRVTFAASDSNAPTDLLNTVVNLIRDQFDLYHAQVYIVDDKKENAVLRESTGYAGGQLLAQGHHIPLDQVALVTQAINTKEPVLVAETTNDPNWLPNELLPETQSELVVPLVVGDEVLGALDIQSRDTGYFTERSIPLFQQMINQIAFLFENAELLSQVSEQTEVLTEFTGQLRIAAEIAGKLNTITDLDLLLEEAVNQLQSRFGFYHAHIYMIDDAGENLTVQAGSGHIGQTLKREQHTIPVEREASLVAKAARTLLPVVVSDVREGEGFMSNPLLPNTRSEVAIPLITGERLLGILDMQDEKVGRFTQADVDTLTTLAGQMASSIESAELFGRVEQERAHAALLYDISNELNIAQTAEEILLILTKPAMQAGINSSNMVILTVDEDGNPEYAEILANWHREGSPPMSVGTKFYLPDMPFHKLWVASPLECQFIADVEKDESIDESTRQLMLQGGSRAMVTVPLSQGGKWIGLMIENWTTPHEFTVQEKNLYNSIIGLASQALASYQLRQAQMEAEQRFRTLVENAPEAIVVFSGETGLFMEANQNAADLYGHETPEELIGKHPGADFSPEYQPDGRTSAEAAGAYIMEAVEGGTPVFDWMHITAQGKEIPCEVRLVRLPGGDIPIIRGSITDITARKTAQDTIVQGDRLKSEFLANMSHELRTPLNSIVGYTDIMLMGIDGDINEEMRFDLEAIQENSQTLLRIINDILDLAKIEAGRVIFELSEVDIKDLLEGVMRNNAGLLVSKPVEMLLEVKNKLPKITVDEGRLEQILNNLVSNAVKFTKKGEITLEAFTEDDWMEIRVKDTGIGIHEKDLQLIFDEFRQADGSQTRTAEGTGLGLNITRHLVQMHSGTIEVESERGVGSTFIVRLPLVTKISPEVTVKISGKVNGDTGGLQKPKEEKKSKVSKKKTKMTAQEKENGKKVEAKIADFTKELKHVMTAAEPIKPNGKGNSKK